MAREKIKHEIRIFDSSPKMLFEFIGKKSGNVENGKILFAKMHNTLPQIFIDKAKEYNLNHKIIFTICLIESNFGGWKTSDSEALGPMQIKLNTINTVEKHFNIQPRYEKLKDDNERRWRQLTTGILNIKY